MAEQMAHIAAMEARKSENQARDEAEAMSRKLELAHEALKVEREDRQLAETKARALQAEIVELRKKGAK